MPLLISETLRIALVGLLISGSAVGGCTTFRRVPPAEFLAKNSPDVVWVTHTNKTVVPVIQPAIVRDTLRGTWQGTSRPVAIPLADIGRFQARVPDKTKTALLRTGGLAGFAASVYFIWIVQAGAERETSAAESTSGSTRSTIVEASAGQSRIGGIPTMQLKQFFLQGLLVGISGVCACTTGRRVPPSRYC